MRGQFMSTKTEFDFYTKLKKHQKIRKPVPNIVKKSSEFNNLLDANIISKPQRGVGFIEVLKIESYDDFYLQKYPHSNIKVKTEIDNQKKFRNTKATNTEKDRIILMRGFQNILINNIEVDLLKTTKEHNIFSAVLKSLKVKKVCFVENLLPFFMAEKLLGDDYVYIHFYGRLPKESVLKKIQCEQYLHFGDYDFVGLSEYLRAKKVYDDCRLYKPKNLITLFDKYSKPRKTKDTKYNNIKISTDIEIIEIVKKIEHTNRFLEQQILFDEL